MIVEKLLNELQHQTANKGSCYHRDIYQPKLVRDPQCANILFSCRFKLEHQTYIFSVHVHGYHPGGKIRCSIHRLCPRRIFSQCIFEVSQKLPWEETYQYIIRTPKYREFYAATRRIPYMYAWRLTQRYLQSELETFVRDVLPMINQIEASLLISTLAYHKE